MKKLALYLTAAATLGFTASASAQITQCSGVTAPAVTSGMSSTEVGGSVETTAPTLATQAVNLTHTHFIITKKGTPARAADGSVDTTGAFLTSVNDVILGADNDGVFNPGNYSRYGISLAPGDTVEVTAVGFNLSQLRIVVQALLTGVAPGGTCCQGIDAIEEARGFCDTLRNNGVTDSFAIQTFDDVIKVFDAFSDRQLSVRGLLASMDLVNTSASALPSVCTGGTNGLPICYGIDFNARYGYKMNQTVAIERMSEVANFAVFPNPVTGSNINVLVDTKRPTNLTVTVYNLLGQALIQSDLGVIDGTTTTQIQTDKLGSGIYFVELFDGQNREVRKINVN